MNTSQRLCPMVFIIARFVDGAGRVVPGGGPRSAWSTSASASVRPTDNDIDEDVLPGLTVGQGHKRGLNSI